jgi:hypothetical protein
MAQQPVRQKSPEVRLAHPFVIRLNRVPFLSLCGLPLDRLPASCLPGCIRLLFLSMESCSLGNGTGSSCRPAGLIPKEDFGKFDASRKDNRHISNLRAWTAIVWPVRAHCRGPRFVIDFHSRGVGQVQYSNHNDGWTSSKGALVSIA